MAELRNRRVWEIELRQLLVGDYHFAVESEHANDAQTTLVVREPNGLRYQVVVTPLEGDKR
jgi:hypothetical protein